MTGAVQTANTVAEGMKSAGNKRPELYLTGVLVVVVMLVQAYVGSLGDGRQAKSNADRDARYAELQKQTIEALNRNSEAFLSAVKAVDRIERMTFKGAQP